MNREGQFARPAVRKDDENLDSSNILVDGNFHHIDGNLLDLGDVGTSVDLHAWTPMIDSMRERRNAFPRMRRNWLISLAVNPS